MDATTLRERASELPREPGVYHFLGRDVQRTSNGSSGDEPRDGDERVLYVGKAVDLRSRVRSYADPRSARIAKMVRRAVDVDFAVTDTETQALLLEANFIKRHQPPYNVRLKDDKSYPLVQLTEHAVPRIEVTRDPDEGATVYGPFTNKGRVDTVVKALRETYGVRGCSDHKYSNRDRPCLDYEMGICTAPCTGEISEGDYAEDVESVKRFFEGETGVLADPLRRAMDEAAQETEFERAANMRDRLAAVEALGGDSDSAVSDTADERAVDVLAAVREGERATVARLHAEDGQLVERDRHRLDAPEGDGVGEVLAAFIPQFYAERELPDAILCSEHPADADIDDWLAAEGVDLRVPGAGREATLVDLALKNARRGGPARDDTAALADALGLDGADRIEGFDVSHAQGKSAVGSNVTFVDGSPDKSGYRRKKLTDENDDYANMRALVRWRAERAVEGRDDRPDPDLLLIDGGEGQLGAAQDALALVGWDVPVAALAKAEELVVTPDGSSASSEGRSPSDHSSGLRGGEAASNGTAEPSPGPREDETSGTLSRAKRSYRTCNWDDDAPQLHLLQRVRDEAHRFAVQYHQTVRDTVDTVLDEVPGVGPSTRKRLLRRFGSVDSVREASTDELLRVDGVGDETVATIERHLT